jgi:putative transposon-encoded protein
MSKDEFVISGYEAIKKQAKPHGNGARVLVPKNWSGENVKIVKVTDDEMTESQVAPIAALMHDSLLNRDSNLENALSKVVKFKSFSDVSSDIVEDFQVALNNHNTRQTLRQRAEKSDNEEKAHFYKEICSTDSLIDTVKRWTR